MKQKIKLFSIVLIILTFIFCISGCQSKDKHVSFFNDSQFQQATFEYDEETNKTKVIFNATLTNNTIYNFNSFSIIVYGPLNGEMFNDFKSKTQFICYQPWIANRWKEVKANVD